jgi:hypothetical protein
MELANRLDTRVDLWSYAANKVGNEKKKKQRSGEGYKKS